MKFIKVDYVPGRKIGPKHRMEALLQEFIHMDIKAARIEYADMEYKNAKSAYKSFYNAVQRYAVPIRVAIKGDDVYLERTDI